MATDQAKWTKGIVQFMLLDQPAKDIVSKLYSDLSGSRVADGAALEQALQIQACGKDPEFAMEDGSQEYDDILAGNAAYEAIKEG